MLLAGFSQHLKKTERFEMKKTAVIVYFILVTLNICGQVSAFKSLMSDPVMANGALSVSITNSETGDSIFSHDPDKSLIPASVMKLITTATALEFLGPKHIFLTQIGYTGSIDEKGVLSGDIIITGGGDPSLGSERFASHYGNIVATLTNAVKKGGIRKIKGDIICDDSYFDYLPVPAEWLWEDIGNYYGAGAYGLSVYDNTAKIHFRSLAESSTPLITGIWPPQADISLTNRLIASGNTDNGYVFSAPYGTSGWIAGSIPPYKDDFVLKASIPDPPLLIAKLVSEELKSTGIDVMGDASTIRIMGMDTLRSTSPLLTMPSPPLSEIITVLNHESINLYAEHLIKELGKRKAGEGSFRAGLDVIYTFLESTGSPTKGVFIVDGSGLSTVNSINASVFTTMLTWIYNNSKNYEVLKESLPDPGMEGTLKNYFKDPLFSGRVFIKSGSMSRVQCYSGYIIAKSGKTLSICIMANNFSGSHQKIIAYFEEILKETINNN